LIVGAPGRRVRFGVVGCGAISTLHQLPALKRCPLVELVAVVDRDEQWGAKVARRFGVPHSYGDCQRLVGQVDAALIATPNTTHPDLASLLLRQGVHVLCEKPVATSLNDLDGMLEAAEEGDARFMAAHCARFAPNKRMLKRILDEGRLGRLEGVSGSLGGPYEDTQRRTDFRKDRHLSGGGVLVDLGVHLIDLAVWIAGGNPEVVGYDSRRAPGWRVETDAEVALAFPTGARAAITCSFTHTLSPMLTVRGSDGWARAPMYTTGTLVVQSCHARVCQRSGMQELVLSDAPVFDHQIEHFCRAILDEAEFLVRDEEVRMGIEVIERCYSGLQTN
jgi:UDP-N-acetyl-2-amino-2-deoxyglucuronate dehydrogenase